MGSFSLGTKKSRLVGLNYPSALPVFSIWYSSHSLLSMNPAEELQQRVFEIIPTTSYSPVMEKVRRGGGKF
jgi:hypothetical protein